MKKAAAVHREQLEEFLQKVPLLQTMEAGGEGCGRPAWGWRDDDLAMGQNRRYHFGDDYHPLQGFLGFIGVQGFDPQPFWLLLCCLQSTSCGFGES